MMAQRWDVDPCLAGCIEDRLTCLRSELAAIYGEMN